MNEEIKNETNEAAQPDKKIIFQVLINKSGQMELQSPIMNDELACYGVLLKSIFMIHDEHKKAQSNIVKAPHLIMNFLRNGKK